MNNASLGTPSGKLPVLLLLWGAAMWGALQLREVDRDQLFGSQHALCGPWGCAPPITALAAMHVFWLTALLPPLVIGGGRWNPRVVQRVGWLLVLLGVVSLAGLLCWEYVFWYRPAGDFQRQYFGQRMLLALAGLVEVPIPQTVVAGMMMSAMGSIRRCRESRSRQAQPQISREASAGIRAAERDESYV